MRAMNSKNKNINDLIDRGWHDMSNLLDEKLPVYIEKKFDFRLRAAVLLVLLFVAVSGVLYFNFQKDKTVLKSGMAGNQDYVGKLLKKIDTESTDNNSVENKNIAIEKNGLKNNRKIDNLNSNAVENPPEYGSAFVTKIKTDSKEWGKKTILETHTSNYLAINNNKIGDAVAPVIKLNSKELIYNHPQIYINDFVPVVSMAKHRVKGENSFSAGISVVSENIQSVGGAEFSLLYNFNLIGDVYLVSGLDISYLAKQRMSNSFFRTYNIKDPLLNFNAENLDNDLYLAYFKSPVIRSIFINKLLYIGVPLMVSVQKGKMNFNIGAKVAYLVSGTNYTSNNELYYGYNFVIKSPYAFYNSNVYNKLDYGLKIGLGYNLTSKLSLNYYLNYSFSWIIDSPNYQNVDIHPGALILKYNEENRYDKNFYFGLGFNYRI